MVKLMEQGNGSLSGESGQENRPRPLKKSLKYFMLSANEASYNHINENYT
jgi:hypothetical protein